MNFGLTATSTPPAGSLLPLVGTASSDHEVRERREKKRWGNFHFLFCSLSSPFFSDSHEGRTLKRKRKEEEEVEGRGKGEIERRRNGIDR